MIQVFVKSLEGKTYPVEIPNDASGSDLISALENKVSGIMAGKRLLFIDSRAPNEIPEGNKEFLISYEDRVSQRIVESRYDYRIILLNDRSSSKEGSLPR